MPGADPFVHLHVHSEYSLLDGASRVKDIVEAARGLGQEAVALTDHGVLYGALEFYEAARNAGIKGIAGCEFYVADGSRFDKPAKGSGYYHLVALAKNEEGWANLIKLSSRASLEGFHRKPRIDHELLTEHAGGLIVLSGCLGGEIPQAIVRGDMAEAERLASFYRETFGEDFFLEVQNHGIADEARVRTVLADLSRRLQIPLVATGDSHYTHADDAESHEVLLAIQTQARLSDPDRYKFDGSGYHFKTGAEMDALFADIPEALDATAEIARRCSLDLSLGEHRLPRFSPIPDGQTSASYLTELARRGVRQRYGGDVPATTQARLEEELSVIEECGFSDYFLIVSDFVNAARCDGVKVGPGRGSAAGSLVAYSLGITSVDPISNGLVFERFLNRERRSMPDIDIDFDDRGRERAIRYVEQKYGPERVAQIITFGTLGARAAIRDVARVLDLSIPDADRIAKLVPATPGITLTEALEQSPELAALYASDSQTRRVLDTARKLEGLARNASTHAAAVVIGSEPVADVVPVQRAPGKSDGQVTQFPMKAVERMGLLKMDFLGLSNLTVIADAVRNIERVRGERVDEDAIPLDDEETYRLLRRGDALGVFQCEGRGARKILMDIQPHSLTEMAAAVALNRPGPIDGGVVDQYIRRKHGKEAVTYPLPELGAALADTYGVIVYQEQVMEIARTLAGFSLGEADVLRAAMGKKDEKKMATQREKFLAGAAANGHSREKAQEIFELMAFFSNYGFNRAHAVCYGLIGYQTAYLKAHYPREYMAALLNMKAEQTTPQADKLGEAIRDCREHGLSIFPPDINLAAADFSVVEDDPAAIRYGLRHIKGVGAGDAEAICTARTSGGDFVNLLDFCSRVPINRRALETLVKAGCFDHFGDRAALLAALDPAVKQAASMRKQRLAGQRTLFDDLPQLDVAPHLPLPTVAPASRSLCLEWERELCGVFLSGHPLDEVAPQLVAAAELPVAMIGSEHVGAVVQIAGQVSNLRAFAPARSSNGARMATLDISDNTGNVRAVAFTRTYEKMRGELTEGALVAVRGRIAVDERRTALALEQSEGEAEPALQLIVDDAWPLADAPAPVRRHRRRDAAPPADAYHITVSSTQMQRADVLRAIFAAHRGPVPVMLHVVSSGRTVDTPLGPEHGVTPGEDLEEAVRRFLASAAPTPDCDSVGI